MPRRMEKVLEEFDEKKGNLKSFTMTWKVIEVIWDEGFKRAYEK